MQYRSPGDLQTGIWNYWEKEETKNESQNENENEKEEIQVDYQKADSAEVAWSYLKGWKWHGFCVNLVDTRMGLLHTNPESYGLLWGILQWHNQASTQGSPISQGNWRNSHI
jgi:hypothetical protein